MNYQSLQSLPGGHLVPPNPYSAVLLCLGCAPCQTTTAEPERGTQIQQGLGQRGVFCSGLEHGNIPVVQPARITAARSLCCALLPRTITLPI